MKIGFYQLIAIACILAVGFTGFMLFTPEIDADPEVVRNVKYWDVYLYPTLGLEVWVLTDEKVFVEGWHEGSHYHSWTNSETNEEMSPLPFHDSKIINEDRLNITIYI